MSAITTLSAKGWLRLSMLVASAALTAAAGHGQARAEGRHEFNLLLNGGYIIDPANQINEPRVVAVAGGRIAAVAETIAAERARRVVDVLGLYVAPGFIDLHGHVATGRIPG